MKKVVTDYAILPSKPNMVDGYLNTQKFYLLVQPEYYQKALAYYNQLKREYSGHAFDLVDISKLREKEQTAPQEDSLAKRIETENGLARTYIDYLYCNTNSNTVFCNKSGTIRRSKT